MCGIGDILCNLKLLAAYIKQENRGIIDMKHIPRHKKTVPPKELQIYTSKYSSTVEENNGLSSSLCFKQPGRCAQPPTVVVVMVYIFHLCV